MLQNLFHWLGFIKTTQLTAWINRSGKKTGSEYTKNAGEELLVNRFQTNTKGISRNIAKNITVIILGDEPPKGMKHLGPKPLLIHENRTIFDIQMEAINNTLPECQIVLVAGFQALKLIKCKPSNVRIVENYFASNSDKGEQRNSLESIRLGINNCTTNEAVIIGGDSVISGDSLKITARENSLVCNPALSKFNPGVISQDGILTSISYDFPDKYAGILSLKKIGVELTREYVNKAAHKNFLIYQLIQHLIKHGEPISVEKRQDVFRIERHTIETTFYQD